MAEPEAPEASIVLFQTEDGRTRIECRFEGDTLWLTQALMAELFQKDVRTINEHVVNIFDEGELDAKATIRKFRIVRMEGSREAPVPARQLAGTGARPYRRLGSGRRSDSAF